MIEELACQEQMGQLIGIVYARSDSHVALTFAWGISDDGERSCSEHRNLLADSSKSHLRNNLSSIHFLLQVWLTPRKNRKRLPG